MVYVPPPANIPKVNAYLTAQLSADGLAKVKQDFELGTCARFSPVLEMVIKDEPSYHGLPHPDIRRAEDAAGRTDGFVIIDDRAVSDNAVWYIDAFATEDQVESDEAESTNVLIKILTKTDCLALTWANYDIGNIDITEDLDNCGVEMPLVENYEQNTINDCGGIDMVEQQRQQDVWLTAEPGEFKESTDPDLLGNFSPRPDRVARLHDVVARDNGIAANWAVPSAARPIKLPNGSEKTFPEGSVVLQQKYDPDYPWPEYKWPEGSL